MSCDIDEHMVMMREWYLRRNCCLSPRQLALAYAVISATTIAIATLCMVLHGAWQVMSFAIIELTGVGVAFLCYARHAADHERIALMGDCLLVERVLAGKILQTRLDPHRTRVAGPDSETRLVDIAADGVRVQVGQFVTAARRLGLAQELRQALRMQREAAAAA